MERPTAVLVSDTENSAGKSVGVPFAKGSDPRRAKGVKGRGGRPTNEFRDSLRLILDRPKVRQAVLAILEDPNHRQFGRVYASVVSQAHGNPTQALTIAGEPSILTVVTKPSVG